MDEANSPYLGELYIVDNFVQRDLSIPLPPPEGKAFRHLILTGRNGCGKTATLNGHIESKRERNETNEIRGVFFRSPRRKPKPPICSYRQTVDEKRNIKDVIIHFKAKRTLSFSTPSGPTSRFVLNEASELEQILINWRTQVAYAVEGNSTLVAAEFRAKLDTFEAQLQALLAPTRLSLKFDPTEIRYSIDLGRGNVAFEALPDGAKAALQLWLDIQGALRRHPNGGVVLIDEPETHLHIGLQEKLLPFLAASFPTVQFVVATHSPAIAASLDNALIYDLSQQRGWQSEDLHGWRYGRVMTEVFGLDDEYSAAVTAELGEVEHLRDLPTRTPEQDARLAELVRRLRSSSHAMAMELWLRMEHPEILADSRP